MSHDREQSQERMPPDEQPAEVAMGDAWMLLIASLALLLLLRMA